MADRLIKNTKRPYTDIHNDVFRDKRISLKAKGLLCTALSLPDNWEFSLRGLRAICKENLTAIQSALDELEKYGYLTRKRQQERGENGHFAGMDYIFTDTPDLREPEDGACTQNVDTSCIQNIDTTCTRFPYAGNVYKEIKKQEINNIPPVSPQGEAKGRKDTKKPKQTFAPGSEAYRCAKYLDEEICRRLPQKPPSGEEARQRWASDFDKCHRLDGYDWRTVMETLIFSQRDDFWSANILSGRKFRAKMVQLMAKMQSAEGVARAETGQRVIERKGVRVL